MERDREVTGAAIAVKQNVNLKNGVNLKLKQNVTKN